MSTFTDIKRKEIADVSAKASNIVTFGLHYKVDFFEIYKLKLICDALDTNDIFNIFTDDEIACLQSKMTTPIYSCNC